MQNQDLNGSSFVTKVYNRSIMAKSTKSAKEKDQAKAYKNFKSLVNMSASQLEKWLKTGDGESIGHKSGKKIIKILRKKKTELTSYDYTHMHKVIAYISRHTAQKPADDVSETNWNYSLKNWGYDYSKK